MWRSRLHKLAHRVIGGSVVMVGLLQQLKEVDLSPLLGEHTAAFVAGVGLVIVLLEFMPVLGGMIDGDAPKPQGDN